jgi:hypothetical protein
MIKLTKLAMNSFVSAGEKQKRTSKKKEREVQLFCLLLVDFATVLDKISLDPFA